MNHTHACICVSAAKLNGDINSFFLFFKFTSIVSVAAVNIINLHNIINFVLVLRVQAMLGSCETLIIRDSD